MKIYGLPKKQNLAHLRVQWFHNEGATRGKSENVLKIKYRTRRGEDQEFLIPVSSNAQRNLRKKVTGVLGKEGADLVMQQYKTLNKECKAAFFGFRLVRWMEGSKHKSKSDAQTLCWLKFNQDNTVVVSIIWAGDEINVTLHDPKPSTNPRAPIGIGYFNAEEDFKQQLARFNNDNKNDGNSGQNTRADEASFVDVEPDSTGDESDEGSEAQYEDTGSYDVRADDVLAEVSRESQADSLGGEHSVSVACEEHDNEAPTDFDVGGFTAEPVGGRTFPARKGKQRRVVDSNPWGVWQPEAIPCTATGLGTDFRLRFDH